MLKISFACTNFCELGLSHEIAKMCFSETGGIIVLIHSQCYNIYIISSAER